ncbi:MAG: zinc transporter ZupT [Rikenellaceae bacterium]
MDKTFLFAFLITLFAGLSTGVGSLIAFIAKTTSKKFLSFSLGLSAGVMIYISFIEIFPSAKLLFMEEASLIMANVYTPLFFFMGIAIIAIIDKLVPAVENPHEMRSVEDIPRKPTKKKLMRVGLMTAVAITIHNFPEGMAVFATSYNDITLGLPIAVAIAIHNIPEGIAVSVPIYHATGSKKKAFVYSFLSGLAEPLGAVIGYLILIPIMSSFVMGVLLVSVAGIMVYISLDELLPAAREFGWHHISIYGLIVGMMVMAVSLILM